MHGATPYSTMLQRKKLNEMSSSPLRSPLSLSLLSTLCSLIIYYALCYSLSIQDTVGLSLRDSLSD
ncbi:hypothetical protein D6D85_00895 [Candidatus Methanodesulfokora washburnensis]|uniref:Uncharacterized protein n=1 Tax=Candidatus Methanodesulfokora washburnensis TaxID=2478471 RepID=A0A3R9R3F2_9CREN|nr:hypothetical protein D6D85_00895 [Candidatus Methanodesulfokores washburnensis]